jgi:hypothetical protein
MIPRKIRKPALSVGKILPLLVTGLLVVLTWAAHLPIWARGGLGLLIVSAGLFLAFGGWGGRPAPQVLTAALQYALRPRRRAWARGQRASLIGVLRRPPTWWWKVVEKVAGFLTPARQTVAAGTVAALITLAIVSLVGWSFWARADEGAASAPPTPDSFVAVPAPAQILPAAPLIADTPVSDTPIPLSPTPPPPTPAAAASVFDVAWQGDTQPGYLRLSPTSGPTTITLVFVGSDVHTQTLLLDRDTAVPLVPAFHPTLTQVQVLSLSPVQVEQVPYAPYQCASAGAWWLWVDPAFSPARLVLYPGTESLAESPGEVLPLAARRANRLPFRQGLYQVTATQPFCLEVWFEN